MKKIALTLFSFTSIFACQNKLRQSETKPIPHKNAAQTVLNHYLEDFTQLVSRKKFLVEKQLAVVPTDTKNKKLLETLTKTQVALLEISFHSNYLPYADPSDNSAMVNLRQAIDSIPCFLRLPAASSRDFKEKIEEEVMRIVLRTNPIARRTIIMEAVNDLEKQLNDEKLLQRYLSSPSLSDGNPHKQLRLAREIVSTIKPHLSLLEELRAKVPDPKLRASFFVAHKLNYKADMQKIKDLIESIPPILFAPGHSTHYFKRWIPMLLDMLDEEEITQPRCNIITGG